MDPKTNKPDEGCMKVQYTSEKFALDDIARIRSQSNRSRVPMRTYYCDKCNFWHLTSQSDVVSERLAALEALVTKLEDENKQLRKDCDRYRQAEGLSKEEKKAIKIDARVLELTERISKLRDEMKKLKTDNSMLITKNIQLKNQIDGKG